MLIKKIIFFAFSFFWLPVQLYSMRNCPPIKLADAEKEKEKIEKMAAASVAQERQLAWLKKLIAPIFVQEKNPKERAVIYYNEYPYTISKDQQN